MLPDFFIDWWFAPWTYAGTISHCLPQAHSVLGHRDGYRIWCEQAGVRPDFSIDFEPAWHIAAISTGSELLAAAQLFAGLIAARENDQTMLSQLALDERRWCIRTAMTQPLKTCAGHLARREDRIETRGLRELACCLETDFPGMWSRLRLLLPQAVAAGVDAVLTRSSSGARISVAEAARIRRCWTWCRNQAFDTAARQNPGAVRRGPGQ